MVEFHYHLGAKRSCSKDKCCPRGRLSTMQAAMLPPCLHRVCQVCKRRFQLRTARAHASACMCCIAYAIESHVHRVDIHTQLQVGLHCVITSNSLQCPTIDFFESIMYYVRHKHAVLPYSDSYVFDPLTYLTVLRPQPASREDFPPTFPPLSAIPCGTKSRRGRSQTDFHLPPTIPTISMA